MNNPSVAIASLRDSSLYWGGAFSLFVLCDDALPGAPILSARWRGVVTPTFLSLPCARGGGTALL